jgi:hypothetical protein
VETSASSSATAALTDCLVVAVGERSATDIGEIPQSFCGLARLNGAMLDSFVGDHG